MFNRIIWTWSFYHNQKFRSLFLMLKKWIMFNSTFCVQLKVNYWLSEEVGGSPRLGRLALKMFRMQTCSSTLASMLQVQYIGFSCFFIKQSSTCFHVHCQWWEWWKIFLLSVILTSIFLSTSYSGMNEFSKKCLNNLINRCKSSKWNSPLDKYFECYSFMISKCVKLCISCTRARLNGICVSGLGKVTAVLAEWYCVCPVPMDDNIWYTWHFYGDTCNVSR